MSRENEIVSAMCAHCKQTLYRQLPGGDLMHVSGLKTCRKGSGIYGAERVETAAACLLFSGECCAVTLSGEDYWAIPRDVYDELRAMLEDWPRGDADDFSLLQPEEFRKHVKRVTTDPRTAG